MTTPCMATSGGPTERFSLICLWAPRHLCFAYQMLKNSGFLPEEVGLKKEMEMLKAQRPQTVSMTKKNTRLRKLVEVSEAYHFCMAYKKGFRKSLY